MAGSQSPAVLRAFALVGVVTLCLVSYFSYYIWVVGDGVGSIIPQILAPPTPVAPPGASSPATKRPPALGSIPEILWYKLGPRGLSDESRQWMDSCLERNPSFRAEVLTDDSAELYVKQKFAARPDVLEIYASLSIPILKADMLRYLLLFADGGVWNDLDVSCEDVPIREWIPLRYKDEVALVVGWEFDAGWGDSIIRQFTSWTVMARPGSPHLAQVIDDIVEQLHATARSHNTTIASLTLDMVGDVVDVTGPRRLTSGIFKSLQLRLDPTIDPNDHINLTQPVLVGDVLILPGFSLAASSNHYQAPVGKPLVTHHYAGSWKNEHGGEIAGSR